LIVRHLNRGAIHIIVKGNQVTVSPKILVVIVIVSVATVEITAGIATIVICEILVTEIAETAVTIVSTEKHADQISEIMVTIQAIIATAMKIKPKEACFHTQMNKFMSNIQKIQTFLSVH
jgi:hypothetical protein